MSTHKRAADARRVRGAKALLDRPNPRLKKLLQTPSVVERVRP
jgi:hypothetical protein